MEKEQIIKLLNEQEYPEFMIENTINKIMNFSLVIAEVFELWVKNGREPDINIEGYSYTELVNNWGMKPIGAFITLDWLTREPEKAKISLRKGIK